MFGFNVKLGSARWKSAVAALAVSLGAAAVCLPVGSAEAVAVPAKAQHRSNPKPPKPPKHKHWKRLKKQSEIPGRAFEPAMREQLKGKKHIRLSSFFLSDGEKDKKYYSAYYTTDRGYTYKMRVDKNGKVVQHKLVKRP